jgi:1-acyl-sn-glycerol-3-phosphate acyltransferase
MADPKVVSTNGASGPNGSGAKTSGAKTSGAKTSGADGSRAKTSGTKASGADGSGTKAAAAKAGSKPENSDGGGGNLLAVGAARASGERAKRRRTPLLPAAPGNEGTSRSARPADVVPTNLHRPRPVPKTDRVVKGAAARSASTRSASQRATTGSAKAAKASGTPKSAKSSQAPQSAARARVGAGVDDIVSLAIAALRQAAAASGLSGEEIDRQVAATLAFVRRRLSGNYTVDDFGFDEDFTDHLYLPLLRPLYKSWFRVEVRGIENIPTSGGALIVANHSGTMALDALMTQVAVHDEHPTHRYLRMLGADLVFRTPLVGAVARKSGCTLAANPDAERLLAAGELVGVWPEGFKGVGKPFSERYKLQRFGRGGFVAAALRTGVPIVPCSIVGAEEIYPMLGNLKTIARLVGAPYIPVTPTFPLLGPLGLIPLPSKWIIEFGAPVDTTVLGTAAADDPMVVFDLTDRIRETIQQTLYSLLLQRKSVFF